MRSPAPSSTEVRDTTPWAYGASDGSDGKRFQKANEVPRPRPVAVVAPTGQVIEPAKVAFTPQTIERVYITYVESGRDFFFQRASDAGAVEEIAGMLDGATLVCLGLFIARYF